ncbi:MULTISPECIES: HK97 gp10 family phage protein [Haloarcula]|uniref:HK97 gp10 family phage protein n=1 Tax=Haloarcula TaxID=2237 RepID=UPI000F8EF490|nr:MULTISPECIES: HK97 gp10 family phage protein [Haloarcula]NHX41388.1 hypothetical protein [Haloarcula sp. R1-2]
MTGMSLFGMSSLLDTLDYEESGETRYLVGTNVEYAVYVEFGTSSNQAQPYLRPAVRRAVRSLDRSFNGAESPQEVAEQLALTIEAEAKREAPVDTGTLKNSITAERLE